LIEISAILTRAAYLNSVDPSLSGLEIDGGSVMTMFTTLSFSTIIPLAAVVATAAIFAVLWVNGLIRH
jgi:hypothetical protein